MTTFLRWIGGKSRLVEALAKYVPTKLDLYSEPFCGSAALFFHLKSQGRLDGCRVILSDINKYLMEAYRLVRDNPQAVALEVQKHIDNHSPEHYYDTRSEWNAYRDIEEGPLMVASFIYMNHANFNGLYRVNQKAGEYNVPDGKKRRVTFDVARIHSASAALQGVELDAGSYTNVLYRLRAAPSQLKKLVYVDPPYAVGLDSDFVNYSHEGFDFDAQVTLERNLRASPGASPGVSVMASNSLAAAALYTHTSWHVEEIETSYSVSAKSASRGTKRELLIRSRGLLESVS